MREREAGSQTDRQRDCETMRGGMRVREREADSQTDAETENEGAHPHSKDDASVGHLPPIQPCRVNYEDRIRTGPPLARTEVIHVDLGFRSIIKTPHHCVSIIRPSRHAVPPWR